MRTRTQVSGIPEAKERDLPRWPSSPWPLYREERINLLGVKGGSTAYSEKEEKELHGPISVILTLVRISPSSWFQGIQTRCC